MDYFVDRNVQADPMPPLREAHVLSGTVKGAIRSAIPGVARVLVYMKPFEGDGPAERGPSRDRRRAAPDL